jgi:DNA-binding transcriptional ArsR family regulator
VSRRCPVSRWRRSAARWRGTPPPGNCCARWPRRCGAERCVHELVDALGVSQPLVSQHLRVLRAAGVVRGERLGREIRYTLADEHVAHIVADAVSHAREPRPAQPEPDPTEPPPHG